MDHRQSEGAATSGAAISGAAISEVLPPARVLPQRGCRSQAGRATLAQAGGSSTLCRRWGPVHGAPQGQKQSVPSDWTANTKTALYFSACRVGVVRQLGLKQSEEAEPQDLVDR